MGYRKEIVRSIVFDGTSIVLLAALLFLRARPDDGRHRRGRYPVLLVHTKNERKR